MALSIWQQSCRQLYLSRLEDETVLRKTMEARVENLKVFGFAQGKEDGRSLGFSHGKRTSLITDALKLDASRLIGPVAAAADMEVLPAKVDKAGSGAATTNACAGAGTSRDDSVEGVHPTGGATVGQAVKKRSYSSVELVPNGQNPVRGSGQRCRPKRHQAPRRDGKDLY